MHPSSRVSIGFLAPPIRSHCYYSNSDNMGVAKASTVKMVLRILLNIGILLGLATLAIAEEQGYVWSTIALEDELANLDSLFSVAESHGSNIILRMRLHTLVWD